MDEVALLDRGGAPWTRLFAVCPSSTGIIGGTLFTAGQGTWVTADATFEAGRGRIVLSRSGSFSPGMLMLFTTRASDVGTTLADLSGRGRFRPLGDA